VCTDSLRCRSKAVQLCIVRANVGSFSGPDSADSATNCVADAFANSADSATNCVADTFAHSATNCVADTTFPDSADSTTNCVTDITCADSADSATICIADTFADGAHSPTNCAADTCADCTANHVTDSCAIIGARSDSSRGWGVSSEWGLQHNHRSHRDCRRSRCRLRWCLVPPSQVCKGKRRVDSP
jgi:hypothetical protein